MRKLTTRRWIGAGACLLLAAPAAVGQQDEEHALTEVRRQLEALEQRLSAQTEARDRTAADLKEAERDIAAARADLERLDRQLRDQERRAAELAADGEAAQKRLNAERDALAQQIRLMYLNGRQEGLKLLLSQETPAAFGRMLVYYDYFNRARSERIDTVTGELDAITQLADEAERVGEELDALRRAQAERLAALNDSTDRRRGLLAELESSIESAGGEVERLRGEEQRLAKLVAELGNIMAAFPADSEEPFSDLKGRLAWPVQGEIISGYGKPRAGGVRWNGVLLKAPQGTPVRAVYHGRVAYADWLPGLGLLLVLDHGDGYMTLYGHNDALLKEPGDWVMPGEPIGRVGDTGGRLDASLYFEIRHNGEPLNPQQWIAG